MILSKLRDRGLCNGIETLFWVSSVGSISKDNGKPSQHELVEG